MRVSILAAVLVMILAACAQPAEEAGSTSTEGAAAAASKETMASPTQTAPAAQMPEKVRTAVEVARAIESSPDQASRILQEHGMSEEDLGALMYEIAQDPELSRAYAEAMGE